MPTRRHNSSLHRTVATSVSSISPAMEGLVAGDPVNRSAKKSFTDRNRSVVAKTSGRAWRSQPMDSSGKPGCGVQPLIRRTRSATPSSCHRAARSCERPSIQVMARWVGVPSVRQGSSVPPWVARATARIRVPAAARSVIARSTVTTACQISSGSSSAQPGCGV